MEEVYKHIFHEEGDNTRLISACPICGTRYRLEETQVLEEKTAGHLIYIQCRKCASSVVTLIYVHSLGISSMSIVTDLNSSEIMKFKDQPPLSEDDVIDIHCLLKNTSVRFE